MAASTSADSNNNYTYDVFISHIGPDVKHTFASHLYRRLLSYGLRVLLDQAELERGGDVLVPQIESAITSASVLVAILSPEYVDSMWYLDNLLIMLESRALIIPVFYGVKASDVRRQAGVYARSLLQHERKGRHDSTRIEKWRNALSRVALFSGFELDAFNGDEAGLLETVVEAVLRRLEPEQRRAAKYVVGLGEKMQDFEKKVLFQNPNVVGIVGVGGVGKTTLAKELFDQKKANYSKYCFLSNVRENARLGFLISLQKQLLETLTGTDKLINSIDEGIEELKKHLSSCSILMIVDDVDHLDQINALLPVQSRIFSDSLVVITSRYEWVIRSSGVENASIYQLTGLNHEHSRKYVVGLGEKMKEFENKVLFENPKVVGIVGVGGVGKTTLAKELFNQKRVNYSKYCFLSNVREEARLGFLISLQKQLLKTLTRTDKLINSIDEGKEELKKHLSSCSILIIIDDVDHLDQINALLPVQSRLFSHSLVVITSRYEGVIRSSGVENASIYQLTGLSDEHSQELFCAYAFNQPYPIEGFQYLVMNFLKVCEGLPLFLRVFGALLNDKNNPYIWEEILAKLRQVPRGEAQEKLQISYQILNREEQQIFLDSSCFFIGQKRDTAIRIWEGSGWRGRLGFGTLVDRCLLGVDEENNIEMHDHLRDFGRAVADTSSPRRLLHSNHIKDMLERVSGTTARNEPVTAVRGIRMVLGEDNDDVNAFAGVEERILELDMSTLELLHTDRHAILERILTSPMHVPRSLIWLRWNKCRNPSLPSWIRGI